MKLRELELTIWDRLSQLSGHSFYHMTIEAVKDRPNERRVATLSKEMCEHIEQGNEETLRSIIGDEIILLLKQKLTQDAGTANSLRNSYGFTGR